MTHSLRLPRLLSAPKVLSLLAASLLLITALAVSAQENANNANANNANLNANRNANTGANANTNTNANLPGNTNANANGNANQGAGTPTPSPTPDSAVEARRDKLVVSSWYYLLVSLIFAIVLLPFSYTIYRAIRYSSATYGPLGLPEGSLRAMIAYTLLVFLGFYILASVLSLSDFRPPDFLLGIVATVIGFYFGSRTGEAKAEAAARAGVVEGTVTEAAGTPASGATVELAATDGKKYTGKTDNKGKYRIEKVPAGDYEIQATLTGQNPSDRKKVTVKAGESQTVDLQLK
ncbi:MAG TPA: carboxypeptidase-like regulatory domain-containing protein [Pyrinomonadaceae bacterium]|nr:carboxypeptidase-like regulatory domain-containing protein [Pyrinomonadaceae bacterium]